MLSKILKGIRNPRTAYRYADEKYFTYYRRLMNRGRYIHIPMRIVEDISGINPYIRYLKHNHGRYVIRNIADHRMKLDLEDKGVSTYLLTFGIREPHSSQALINELNDLKIKKDGEITVLECGANIGYFVLLEASVLTDSDKILAVEPSSDNVKLLRENVHLSEYDGMVDIEQCAISSTSGTAHLSLSTHSNQHKLTDNYQEDNTLEIKTYNPIDYIQKKGYEPEDINIIRMDIQGKEYDVFKSLEDMLKKSTDLIIFVETHSIQEHNRYIYIYKNLEKYGFKIVSVAVDSERLDWTYQDLLESGRGVELIVRK